MQHAVFLTFIFTLFYHHSKAQDTIFLSLENESIQGTNYLFDIYLTKSSSSVNPAYLGNTDFIIAFNPLMFSSPILSKTGSETDFCTFVSRSNTIENNQLTRSNYFNNTAVSIEQSNLIINLNGPTPMDIGAFNATVAELDTQSTTHRLGRFQISGIVDPSGTAHLQWKTRGNGLKTKVFSLIDTAPFISYLNQIITDTNSCPDQIDVAMDTIPSGHYQAAIDLSVEGMIHSMSTVTFQAGQSVTLKPHFNLQAGSTLVITIHDCP